MSGATEEQIEAAARAIYHDQKARYGEEITAGIGQPCWRHMARAALSASASADPADERHDAEERLARIQRLLGPLRNRIDEYGAVPLRHAVISTLEALSGRSAEECEGLSVNDHCCQHPKCPGGGLCCCESEDHAATVTSEPGEELIAEAENLVRQSAAGGNPVAEFGVTKEIAFVRGVRFATDALAAPVEVDEAKLAEVVARVYDEGAMDSPADYPLQCEEAMQYGRDTAHAVAKWLRGENP